MVNSIVYSNAAVGVGTNYQNSASGPYLNCCTTPLNGLKGSGNISVDPRFLDAPGGDYRLSVSSPCVDAGTNEGWMADAVDLRGRPRVIGTRPDIGAYETGWYLQSTSDVHGAIAPAGTVWVTPGGNQMFSFVPAAYYHVSDVSVDGMSRGAPASLVLSGITNDGSIFVSFTQNLAPLGTPEWWLASYGWTNAFGAAETRDTDHDGMPAWREYIAGTDPTDAFSCFRFVAVSNVIGVQVYCASTTGRTYSIQYRTNLFASGWTNLPGVPSLPGTGGMILFNDTNAAPQRFYRLTLQRP